MSATILPDLRRLQRVLIIRLSSIGDVIHALPVSAALGESFPHLELTWIVEEMSAEVVTGNPYLKEVLVVPRSRWKQGRLRSPAVWKEYLEFLGELRRRRFDLTLDLQGYGKSGLYALATGAPHRFGWHRMRDGSGLVSRSLPLRPHSLHRVDWFLNVPRALGAPADRVCFPLDIPPSDRLEVENRLTFAGIAPGQRFAVLNPAAGNETRRWGVLRYAELAVALALQCGLPSVAIGSGKDREICAQVCLRARDMLEHSPQPARQAGPVSFAGQTSLKQLAALLGAATVHIAGDTGSVHLAAAVGCPVVSLFGPTDPAHAGPWGQEQNVLSGRHLCGRTCTVRHCPQATPRKDATAAEERSALCLQAISVADVLKKVQQVLYDPAG